MLRAGIQTALAPAASSKAAFTTPAQCPITYYFREELFLLLTTITTTTSTTSTYYSCCPITAPCSPQKPLSSLPRNQRLKPTQISPLSSSGPIIISIQPSAGHDDRYLGHDDRYPVHATTTGYMLIDSSFLLFGSKSAPLKQTPIFQSSHG